MDHQELVFEIGEKVIVLDLEVRSDSSSHKPADFYYSVNTNRNTLAYTPDMKRLAGKVYTIGFIMHKKYGYLYTLEGVPNRVWTREFLKSMKNFSNPEIAKALLEEEY